MNLIKEMFRDKKVIFNLAKNDFKSRYAGSFLGILWAFIQPCVTVIIYAFIFGSGLRIQPTDNTFPFLLFLISGIIPYFFFNDAINTATNSIIEYSYVLKKMVFNADYLPLIKVLSSVYVHVFFILLGIVIFMINGHFFSLYLIQVLYYSFCAAALAISIAYFTSALTVFFRDISQIVNIIMQFMMWLTPIMYDLNTFPSWIGNLLKFNPLYYIVEGYRDSFFRGIGFYEHPVMTIYFWSIVITLFVIGRKVFNKLKSSFVDVL